jgi:hypothetical protein
MKRLASLLATVSVSAILAAGPAVAQNAGLIVEATGAFLMGEDEASESIIDDITTARNIRIDALTGGYASFSLGKKLSPTWDITGRFAITDMQPGDAEYTQPPILGPSDKLGTMTSDLEFQTLDLEGGYSPELSDDFDLRFFAGARGLHYTNTLNTTDKIGDTTREREFYGVGPRAGLEFESRFGNSPVGFSGLVGGAVVFGTERQNDDVFGTSTTTDVAKAVVDLEAQAALDLHLGDQAKVSVGYRGEQLSDVNDFSLGGQPAVGQLVHGPFIKFKATF